MYRQIQTELPPLVWLVIMETNVVDQMAVKEFTFIQALGEAEAIAKAKTYFPDSISFRATKTVTVLS